MLSSVSSACEATLSSCVNELAFVVVVVVVVGGDGAVGAFLLLFFFFPFVEDEAELAGRVTVGGLGLVLALRERGAVVIAEKLAELVD